MRNDQNKTCINKGVISFSNVKIATCMFLEQYDEEIIEAAKRKLKKNYLKTNIMDYFLKKN